MINSLNKSLFLTALLLAPLAHAEPAAPHDTLSLPATPASPAPLSSAAVPPPAIDVSNVSAPSIGGVGVLDEKNGGLSPLIWKETTQETAASYLSWIHAGVTHPILRDLTLHLLMSQATPPAGSDDSWFTQRLQALIALGANDKAEDMIGAVPGSMVNDSLQQARAELILLRGDSAQACKMQAGGSDVLFWQKLGIICKATSGQRDEAMLALDILRESNAKDELFLQEAVHRLTDKTFSMKTFPARLSVFDVAVIRLAGETAKLKDRLDSVPPVMLKYIAADASLDPKLRDKAESKAIMLGMLPVKDSSKPPPQPFATPVASDVTTLITAFESGNAPTDADAKVIARLAVDDSAAIQDTRRIQRMLTLMEPFGFRVAPETWEKLFARKSRYDGDIPPGALLNRLTQATQTGRKAEIILLSALILNSNDVEKTSEIVLLPIIKGLLAAGFTKEAHTIAYDAIQSYRAH